MKEKRAIAIIGAGRVGRAVAHYLKKFRVGKADFPDKEKEIKNYGLLIGALPGETGERCLELALKYKKDLIDVSDVDPPAYLKKKKEIAQSRITVIPGCGFCPGLVNFIAARELDGVENAKSIEIKAGSLSRKRFFYPFLWCFEDIVLGHRLSSHQVILGKEKIFPPFSGYKREGFFGIDAESYYCASGFENMFKKYKVKDFTYRVIRPYGFMNFFMYLENQGFFAKANIAWSKRILESQKMDNLTLAEIRIIAKDKNITWKMQSSSRKQEPLNSMQKITASVPAAVARLLIEGKIKDSGLLFMEELGRQRQLFAQLLKEINREVRVIRQ